MPNTAPTSTGSGRKSGSTPRCSPPSSTTSGRCGGSQLDPGGEVTARFVFNASGVLTVPKPPDIDGVDSFGGAVVHTARWDHHLDLTGKRVAVIGTGASAVQLIPQIAPIVKELTVFQRTPIWCFPKFDVPLPKPAHWALRAARRQDSAAAGQPGLRRGDASHSPAQYFTVYPLARWMEPVGRAYLRRKVAATRLCASKLTPRYTIGCKRPGFHNTYLSTFNRDNVRLVTEPIDKITSSAVATTDGASHEIDVLVLATGFHVFDSDSMPTFAVTGSGGLSLTKFWDEHRLQAYEGVSVPGFPNLFSVMGPYGYVGSSYFALIEAQTRHIVRCLTQARSTTRPGSRSPRRPTPATSPRSWAADTGRCSGRTVRGRPTATTSTSTATWRYDLRPRSRCIGAAGVSPRRLPVHRLGRALQGSQLTAVGCAPDRSEGEPPPLAVRIHANDRAATSSAVCRLSSSSFIRNVLARNSASIQSTPARIAHTMIRRPGSITGSTTAG